MGMAASQVRFLSLQNRKNTVGLNLMTLSNRKLALSRDMNRIANEYNEAMNMKTLKWSGDSGITYADLTYDTLMKPNNLNATLPYIVTDAQGRVVLDDMDIELDGKSTGVSYRDLAMMISAYSGKDDQGHTSYNNTANLSGGTNITATDIKNAEVGHETGENKASSGKANELGYEIISTASQTGSNTLRYDLMAKLGLISEAEVDAITDLELELYGPSRNPEADKFPVGTLMGDYYFACANYEAYKSFIQAGDFEFGINNSSSLHKDDYKIVNAIDGSNEIHYDENIDGTGTSISFDGVSSSLSKVDLTKRFDAATGATSDITTSLTGKVAGSDFLNYEITPTGVKYDYAANPIVSSMGNMNVEWSEYSDKDGDMAGKIMNGNRDSGLADANGSSWADLINGNKTIVLVGRQWGSGGTEGIPGNDGTKNFASEEPIGYENLTKFVTAMGDAIKTNQAIAIDEQAMNDAVKSTVAQFSGKITNNGNIYYHGTTRRHDRKTSIGYAFDDANSQNLVGWTGKPNYRLGVKDEKKGVETVAVNAKNVFNTLMTFYNYYYSKKSHGETYTVIVDAASAAANGSFSSTAGGSSTPDNSIPPALSSYGTTDTTANPSYIIKKGTYNDGYSTYECVDFFENNAGSPGRLVQRDLIEKDDEGNILGAYREYYDITADGKMGTGAMAYELNATDYENNKNKVGILSGLDLEPSSGADSEKTYSYQYNLYQNSSSLGSNGVLTLVAKDPNGNDVTYRVSTDSSTYNETSNADGSTYTNTIFGKPANTEETLKNLEDIMNDAKAAVDEAEAEKAKYFDSTENKMMDYFDALFKMIAENGWVYDPSVNSGDTTANKNYLNAKLQNNMYFITEVDTLDGTDFNYATKIATNVSKVFEVYDKDAQNAALSKYEAEKADINAKEQQVDIRMNKLEAEQDAISTELDSIKKIIDDNVSVTFKIFT